MFQGLRTVVMRAADLEKSKAWYAQLLGIKPYYDTPYYVGFNVGTIVGIIENPHFKLG